MSTIDGSFTESETITYDISSGPLIVKVERPFTMNYEIGRWNYGGKLEKSGIGEKEEKKKSY